MLTDQADKSENSSKNKHPNVGRIEVVVLRCDYEDEQPTPREKPRTTSVAKELPTRNKPPTVRESLGGLMGIFDGASDLSLDGADDRQFSLDGQAYDHPGVIVNQYGQPYDTHAPYYQTPAGRQQGSKYYDNGRPIAAGGQYQQPPVYTTNPVAYAPAQLQAYQGSPAAPAQGLFERIYTSLPQAQHYTTQPPAPAAQSPQYVYAVPQYQIAASQPYRPRKIPIETQRQAIWTLGPPIGRHFGVHHRFLAAAAPYISVLRDNNVGRLNDLGREKVMQELRSFRDAGRFPDGTALHMLEDPLEREREREEKLKREILELVRAEKGERGLDDFGFERDSFTRSDKSGRGDKKSDAGSRKTVEHFAADGKKGSTSNKAQSSDPWGENNKAGNDNGGNSASPWGDQNNNNDNNGQQAGGWADDNDNNNQNNAADNTNWGQPADTAWEQANNNQQAGNWGNASAAKSKSKSASKPSTTSSNTSKPSTRRPTPSHHSKTSSTQTSNPHAHIQPYFATWRDPQPLPHRPSTALNPPLPHSARNPYTHPNAGADYVHRTCTPKYLDEMDRPFAVFVFKYRSVGRLGEILGRDVGGDVEGVRKEVSRGVLMGLSRERLVEEVLRDVERRGKKGEGKNEEAQGGEEKKKKEKKEKKSDAGGDGWAKQSSGGKSKGGAAGGGWDAEPDAAKNVQWDNNNKQASVKNDGWGSSQNAKPSGGWAQTGGGKTGGAQHEAGYLPSPGILLMG